MDLGKAWSYKGRFPKSNIIYFRPTYETSKVICNLANPFLHLLLLSIAISKIV